MDDIQRLLADSGGQAKISLNQATGAASFVRLPGGAGLAATRGLSSEASALAFFNHYGGVFGITNARTELNLTHSQRDELGQMRMAYQQVYQGLPVFAGVLKVHLNREGRITAVNGAFIPDLALNTTPAWSAHEISDVALDAVLGQNNSRNISTDIGVVQSNLTIFRAGLAQGVPGRNHLVYQVEVANPAGSVREFLYIDAHTGKIVAQITGVHEGLDRKVSETSLGNVVWQDSAGDPDPITAGWAGGTAQQVTDWQNEIDGAAETYNLFASMTNGAYLSYDGLDAIMRTVNNDPGINCPNANWNGTSTNYCSNVTGDDTVAHEWGHAYTEHTNNLIYQWQSGALNESYSDIWGEVVDLLNGRGTDSPGGPRSTGSCSVYGSGTPKNDDTYRWLSGEDDPAFGGAIRDMWDPTCYGDPGKVMDTAQYVCSTADGGGVHTNSGVPNHGFALMVDGGTYNGQTITGIGLTKSAHIHWQAQNMLTPASNFADHADALEAACSTLTSVNLNTLNTNTATTTPSGEIITTADCAEVAKVITAVEFRTDPAFCNFTPLLDPSAPALCSGGTVNTISLQDWEAGLGSWTVGTRNVANPSTFDTPDWAAVGSLPSGAPAGSTQAAFVADLVIGNCTTDDETGVLYLQSPSIAIPAGASTPQLAFDHWVATELDWDGGNLKISLNGGAFTLVPGSAYTFNAYNQNLKTSLEGNTNPLAGESAFTGTDGGSTGGSWGQSQISLSGIAAPGDSIVLRYEMGVDGCNGVIGWYVDNVHTYSCGAAGNTAPAISGLPDQTVVVSDSKDNAIDLWSYASDNEDADSALTFSITNSPVISAGVTLDSNRYIDINPATGWTGSASVTVQVEDSGSLTNSDAFQVTITNTFKVYLPIILKPEPPPSQLSVTEDTNVLQGNPSSNFGSASDMWVGYDADGCNAGSRHSSRSLIKIDASGIPPGTTISSATLYVRLVNACWLQGINSRTVTAYRINNSWSSSSATWNTQPGTAEAYGAVSVPLQSGSVGDWFAINITSLVQGWVNGAWANNGLMLKANESSGSPARMGFATINWSGASYDPYVSVTYPGTLLSENIETAESPSVVPVCRSDSEGFLTCTLGRSLSEIE